MSRPSRSRSGRGGRGTRERGNSTTRPRGRHRKEPLGIGLCISTLPSTFYFLSSNTSCIIFLPYSYPGWVQEELLREENEMLEHENPGQVNLEDQGEINSMMLPHQQYWVMTPK